MLHHHPPCRREDHGRRRYRRPRRWRSSATPFASASRPRARCPVYREEIWTPCARRTRPPRTPRRRRCRGHAGRVSRSQAALRGGLLLPVGTVWAWTLPRPPVTSPSPTSPSRSRATASRARLPGVQAPPRRTRQARRCCSAARQPPPPRPAAQARQGRRPAARAAADEPAPPAAGLHAAAGLQLRRLRSGREHRDRRPVPPALRGAGDRRSRRGGRRRGRGGQHRRHRSPTTPGPTGELADRGRAPAGRGRRGRGRGPGADRGRTARGRRGHEDDGLSPEEAQIDEAIEQRGEPARRRAGRAAHAADDTEWRTWSGAHRSGTAVGPHLRLAPTARSRARTGRPAAGAIGAGDDARTPKLTRALPASATIRTEFR